MQLAQRFKQEGDETIPAPLTRDTCQTVSLLPFPYSSCLTSCAYDEVFYRFT